MEIQWSDKRSRSIGSRKSGSVKQKEVLVYHRRSVQERDAAAARRLANLERKELEAVEGMQLLGVAAKYSTGGLLPGYMPDAIKKEVTASLLLLKMKRGLKNFVQRVRYGPSF
jgi:hypothetical protein